MVSRGCACAAGHCRIAVAMTRVPACHELGEREVSPKHGMLGENWETGYAIEPDVN